MGYRIHRDDVMYKVVEVVDGEVREIKSTESLVDAQSIQRKLNFGGGFDGWTPEFFLHRISVSV